MTLKWVCSAFLFLLLCVQGALSYECTEAGIYITDSTGVLNSSSDSKNKHCFWYLAIPEGKYLRLNFTKFSLRRQQLCVNSFVEVTSVESGEVRYCGDQTPPILTYTGPQDLRIYSRIGTTPVPGFTINFWTVDEFLACPSGQKKCKNERCFRVSEECDGQDQCGDATDEANCEHSREDPSKVCGRPSVAPSLGNEYIVGGKEAVRGSWPWQVSLQMKDTNPSGHFCGGALLDNLWVVTAAHCFETRTASEVRVRLGSHDTFVHGEGELVRYVEKVVSHPKYDDIAIENDIALLKLSAPVKFDKSISPICLPEANEESKAGTYMYATGWGDGKYMEKIEVLRQAMLPIMEWDRCNKLYFGEVTKNTICTGYDMGGHSPCQGDSGGPLVSNSGGVDPWKLYGVVSWSHEDCGNRQWPSVYTQVSSFVSWIQTVVEQ